MKRYFIIALTVLFALVAFAGFCSVIYLFFLFSMDRNLYILPNVIIFMSLSLFSTFSAYGLWTQRRWGRITAIVLLLGMALVGFIASATSPQWTLAVMLGRPYWTPPLSLSTTLNDMGRD